MQTRIRLWLLLLVVPAVAAANASNYYQAGVKAFQEEKYEEALRFFKQAQSEGIDTPTLRYNIGSAYFRAGQYQEAGKQFQILAGHPDWSPLALYNLGLTAEARGDREAAIDYYKEAYHAAADTSRIKQRAALKLRELAPEAVDDTGDDKADPHWYGLFSASMGYDDNAVLAPDNALYRVSKEGDAFTELYAFGGRYLKGNFNDGFRIHAGAYARLYANESEYSYGTLFTAINRDKRYDKWRTRAGLAFNADFIDDHFYATTPTLQLALDHYLKDLRLRLANTLGWVEAGSRYEYLTGLRNRTSAEIHSPIYAGNACTGYEFEYNRRRDLQTNSKFFSYSPLRHKAYVKIDYPLAPKWHISLRGEFRRSLYPDTNRQILADGSINRYKREDDRLSVSLQGEYNVTDTFDIFTEYSHTDNDSNDPSYSYTTNQIILGCRLAF